MAAGREAADNGSGSGDDEREAGGVYPTKASEEGGVSEQCCRLEMGIETDEVPKILDYDYDVCMYKV